MGMRTEWNSANGMSLEVVDEHVDQHGVGLDGDLGLLIRGSGEYYCVDMPGYADAMRVAVKLRNAADTIEARARVLRANNNREA